MKYAGKSVDSRWAWLVPVAVFALISLPSMLMAQGTSGSISGIVQDSQGALIPRAKVTAFNQDQNAVNGEVATDSAGVFAFPNLPAPATYYYWVIKEHLDVELFCGITPLRARPTRETLRGIYRGPGERRGARRPARTFEELLQGIAVARGAQEH